MKKRFLLTLAVAFLVMGFSGQSFAYFGNLELIRAIYDPSVLSLTEVGSDLGAKAFTTSGAYGNNIFTGNNVNTSSFADAASTLRVSYFAQSTGIVATNDFWMTAAATDTSYSMKSRQSSTLTTAENSLLTYYGTFGTPSATVVKNVSPAYYQLMDAATVGSMKGTLNTPYHATISLAKLATVGYVDTNLYYFDYNNANSGNPAGTLVATIRTFLTSDGRTVDLAGTQIATMINPNAVPVPPSLLLFGSSLLGLVGIRRFRRNGK